MNNLILVRHGQSLWNLEKRFTGWTDIDLTEQGKSEAKYARQLINKTNIKFDACFSSFQKRAINTLEIILNVMNLKNSKTKKAWQLNERHYGALTGLNKDEMMKKHGKDQGHIWRRSFDTPPPPMDKTHPLHTSINKTYSFIPRDKVPSSESLKDTFERVIPYYEENIATLLNNHKNILISAHGNSLRALCKKILNVSNKKIIDFEIPTGNPLLITFDKKLEVKKFKYLDIKRAKKVLFNV